MLKHHNHINNHKKHTKFYQYVNNNFHIIVLVVTSFMVLMIMNVNHSIDSDIVNDEKNCTFEQPWFFSVDNGKYNEVILPTNLKVQPNSHLTLKNQLPKKNIDGATILMRTSQQKVSLYVGENLIYSSHEKFSDYYHLVRLPTNYFGEEIKITLSSPYERYSGCMNQIYIGSKTSNLSFLFCEKGIFLIVGFMIFMFGVLSMITFLFVKQKKKNLNLIYLNAFFICAGYWILVESTLLQFFLPHPILLTNSSIFALTLLPVFSSLYYYNSCVTDFHKARKTAVLLTVCASLVMGIIACINQAEILLAFPYYIIFAGIYIVTVFISIVFQNLKSENPFSPMASGVILLCICGFFELLFYFIKIENYIDHHFLIFGLVLFCIMMIIDFVGRFTKIYNEAIKVNKLTTLAYTDSLTGQKNRTAFLEKMATKEIPTDSYVTMGMFDINNLKMVNDTKGHLAGDSMLKNCAKLLQNSIREDDELYRIGGDEFVAILFHKEKLDLTELEKGLEHIIAKENSKSLSCDLSIAYGYATFSKSTDVNLFETLERADAKMYACKKTQKIL